MEAKYMYNWDDIEVGRYELNHSENFFVEKHSKHEKFDAINFDLLSMEDKENENKGNVDNNLPESLELNRFKNSVPEEELVEKSPNENKLPLNIPKQTNCVKNVPTLVKLYKNVPSTTIPSIYKYTEIYEKKKQTRIRKILEEEQKQRMFRSKPAPKFNVIHDQQSKKNKIELEKFLTMPVTPLVLKKSKEAEEKKKIWREEYKKRNEPPRFVHRDPHVLYEEPFKPQKTERFIKPQPFHLHMEKRLEERKQYDDNYKKTMDEKKKQEDEERKRREDEFVKELRRNITFKARPNPFK